MIIIFRFRIRELRESAGYKSQQSFADAFGIAQSTVGGWEAGKREPNYETTIRLADFFHVSIDYLIGHSDYNSSLVLSSDCWTGKNLKEIRLQRGETPEQVSKITGIPLEDYLRYEEAKMDPPVSVLYCLSDHYCCDIDFLLEHSWGAYDDYGHLVTASFRLNSVDEQRLVEQFRLLSSKQQKSVFSQIDAFLNPEETSEKSSIHAG